MNDQVFIEAILASPDDASLRLVYADWLEERGDPRGEYVRLWRTIPAELDADRRAVLEARCRAWIDRHGYEWERAYGLVETR